MSRPRGPGDGAGSRTGRRPRTRGPQRRSAGRIVVLPTLAVAWCLPACSDYSQPAAYEAPRGADRVIVGLSTEITSGGRRVLRVEADSGFTAVESPIALLVGVEARAFGEDGFIRMTLQADSGWLDEETRIFTASGNVRARSQDGAVSLETAELVYDPTTGRLRTDSAVTVDGRGRTERGSCFEGDPLLTSWRVCGSPP